MNRFPKQLFMAEQAATDIFYETRCLVWKGVFWSTQAMSTAEQVVTDICFWKMTYILEKCQLKLMCVVFAVKNELDICQYV